jgi:hypothetical protein
MLARGAALTLLLSGPGLAAPPAPQGPAACSPALDEGVLQPERPHLRSGLVLGTAAVFTVASGLVAGLAIASKQDLRRHVQELQAQGYRTQVDDLLLDMRATRYKADRGLAIGWGIFAAGLWSVGAWLYSIEPKRMRVAPLGGPRSAGLVLTGRF